MKIVLASHSPRRQELLKGLGVDFSVNVINGIEIGRASCRERV